MITLQGYTFVKQIYPLDAGDAGPVIRVPELASLSFVITFRVGRGGSEPGTKSVVPLVFGEVYERAYDHSTSSFEAVVSPIQFAAVDCTPSSSRTFFESMGEWPATGPDEAIAYTTLGAAVPARKAFAKAGMGHKLTLFISDPSLERRYWSIEVPLFHVPLRGRIFEAGGEGEFGTLVDLTSGQVDWLPRSAPQTSVERGEHMDEDDSNPDGYPERAAERRTSVSRKDPWSLLERTSFPARPRSASLCSRESLSSFTVVEQQPLSAPADDFCEVASVDLALAADLDPPVSDLAASTVEENRATSPDSESDHSTAKPQQVPTVDLMRQVGSLLIGSRVGQMLVQGVNSSGNDFDLARVRTRYTCSPIYMLGVEYRMLTPRQPQVFSPSTLQDERCSVDYPESAADITKVICEQNEYSGILQRCAISGPEMCVREVVRLSEKAYIMGTAAMASWFESNGWTIRVLQDPVYLRAEAPSSRLGVAGAASDSRAACKYTVDLRFEQVHHAQLSAHYTLAEICVLCLPLASGSPAQSILTAAAGSSGTTKGVGIREAAEARSYLVETLAFLAQELGKSAASECPLLQETINAPGTDIGGSFAVAPQLAAQIIPTGQRPGPRTAKHVSKGRRMGGQCFYWSSRLKDWTLQSVRVSPAVLQVHSLINAKTAFSLPLQRYRLLRSADGTFRLALVGIDSSDGGKKHLFMAFDSDDYAMLCSVLEGACASHPDPEAADASDKQQQRVGSDEWMEQNRGIISEFVYDFQARFWMTYRRAFDRIGQTLLSTDAGWGCMLRTGQSLVAEAMARVLLGRGTVQDCRFVLMRCRVETARAAGRCRCPQQLRQDRVQFFRHPDGDLFCPQDSAAGGANGHCGGSVVRSDGPRKCSQVHPMPSPVNITDRALTNQSKASVFTVSTRRDGVFPVKKLEQSLELRGKPLLILFPLRLGIDRVNPCYYPLIKGALRSHLSVGIAGGRTNRSLYFVGHQDDDLLYLDPHTARPALVSVEQALYRLEQHTDTVRHCPISDLDPSMLLGFLCSDGNDLQDLGQQLEALHQGAPLFSFQ